MAKLVKVMAAGSWLAANWWIVPAVALLIGFIFLMSQVESCNDHKFQQKTADQKSEIEQGKGEVKQIEEQRNETKTEINAANQNTAAAVGNAAAVANTDSGTRNSSREAAIREFCKDHLRDSLCKDK